ncbi:MAG: FAD-dependent oxidoreductase [Candidatus Saccharimonadales bacterium]
MDSNSNNNSIVDAPVRDVIMIGAGPSALAAAVYTTREDIDTVLYEKGVIGGLAATTDWVDNYPGYAKGIAGLDLAEQLQVQAERFGATIDFGDVSAIRDEGDTKVVVVDGKEVRARSVLIATGSDYVKLGIPGEKEYYGRGVHYCATCDGAFYRDKRLVVVGGGNSGVQEAIFLTRFSPRIDLLVRSTIKASEVLQRDLQPYIDSGQVVVHLGTIPEEIVTTDGKVTSVSVAVDGTASSIDTDGVFVFIGLKPNTQFLEGSGVELDEQRLVKTDRRLETNIAGIFACGDVRSGATMQIASAVGEGATAALMMREYLDDMKKRA